jgi:hypothetical protein
VYRQLEQELRRPTPSTTRDYLYKVALWHASNTPALTDKVGTRGAFVTPSGKPITVARARAPHERNQVLLASVRSPLSDAAEAAGLTVIVGPKQGPIPTLAGLLAPFGVTVSELAGTYALPTPASDDAELQRWAPLSAATQRLVEAWGGKISRVQLGHFGYPGSGIGERVAISQREFGALTPLAEIGELSDGFLTRARVLVVNADNVTVRSLIRLSGSQPEFAAYLLVKLFFLGSRLDVELDGELARLTAELRA